MRPREPLPMGQTQVSSTRVLEFIRCGFQDEPLVREQRCKIVKMRFVLGLVRFLAIHGLDFQQREKFFLFLRWAGSVPRSPNFPVCKSRSGGFARVKVVNVLGAGQVIETLRNAKSRNPSGKISRDALGKQHARAFGIFLQDVKDDLVLAHRAEIFHAHFARHFVQIVHGHRLKFGDVQ